VEAGPKREVSRRRVRYAQLELFPQTLAEPRKRKRVK
jgi:hypothetical protein